MGKRIILILSFMIAIVGLGAMMYLHSSGSPIPLWDEIAVTYGGVFCVFWFFDTLGKMVSSRVGHQGVIPPDETSGERGGRPAPRPRPRLAENPEQQSVVPGTAAGTDMAEDVAAALSVDTSEHSSSDWQLQRVGLDDTEVLQSLIDEFVVETYALEERVPERSEDGHVVAVHAAEQIAVDGTYCFVLKTEQGQPVGATIAALREKALDVQMLFVVPTFRRRGIGSTILEKVAGFFQLLQPNCSVVCEVPTVNHRAQKFFQTNGFMVNEAAQESLATAAAQNDGVRQFILPANSSQ